MFLFLELCGILYCQISDNSECVKCTLLVNVGVSLLKLMQYVLTGAASLAQQLG